MRPVRVARRIIKETLLVSRTRTNRDVWEPCHRRNEASKPIWSYSNVLDRKHVITAVEDHFGRKELEPYAGLAPFVDERKLDHRPILSLPPTARLVSGVFTPAPDPRSITLRREQQ